MNNQAAGGRGDYLLSSEGGRACRLFTQPLNPQPVTESENYHYEKDNSAELENEYHFPNLFLIQVSKSVSHCIFSFFARYHSEPKAKAVTIEYSESSKPTNCVM
jgi:hypothetical protein